MENDLIKVLSNSTSGAAGAASNSKGTVGTANTKSRNDTPTDPLIELLTQRLTQQGQGIASSTSSNLQKSIDDAVKSAQQSGAMSTQALQSARDREISFARGEASDTYTTAMEGRTGYGTQVAGLRALTETTEKSIRDLDARYQEAILSNDSATMKAVSDLKIKKLEFQQAQEESFYSNLMSTVTLQQNALAQEKQSEQFWAKQDSDREQFVMQMSQSSYQFEKNLGIQYQELGLKEQGLELERQRNAISLAEYNLKKSELNKVKDTTGLQSLLFNKLIGVRNERGGAKLGDDEAMSLAIEAMTALASTGVKVDLDSTELTNLVKGTFDEVNKQALTTSIQGYGSFTDTTAGQTGGSSLKDVLSNVGGAFKYQPGQFTGGKEGSGTIYSKLKDLTNN